MEDNCLGVSSFLFIQTECDNSRPRNCSILNTFGVNHYSVNRNYFPSQI